MARKDEYCSSATPVAPPVFNKHFRPYILQLAREFLYGTLRIPSPEMSEEVKRAIKRNQYDAIVADSVFVAQAVPKGIPYTLIAHNVEALIEERIALTEKVRGVRWHHQLRARELARLEASVFREARRVVALSDLDAQLIRSRFGRNEVLTLPFGADIEALTPPPGRPARKYDLIFVGAMFTDANARGAKWFLREILPLVRRVHPECNVAIVGSEPDEELIRIGAAIPGVIVTGSVMDVKPWLWSSKVSIVPLQVGGGIRLKIYEAMAASLPIVSTSIGAEGLMISPGKDILIADTPEEFACQLVRLLDNPRFRDEIARAGHEMVRDSFSWDRVAEAVDSILAY